MPVPPVLLLRKPRHSVEARIAAACPGRFPERQLPFGRPDRFGFRQPFVVRAAVSARGVVLRCRTTPAHEQANDCECRNVHTSRHVTNPPPWSSPSAGLHIDTCCAPVLRRAEQRSQSAAIVRGKPGRPTDWSGTYPSMPRKTEGICLAGHSESFHH